MFMKFHEEITEIVNVLVPEIKFSYGQVTKKAGYVILLCHIFS